MNNKVIPYWLSVILLAVIVFIASVVKYYYPNFPHLGIACGFSYLLSRYSKD